MDKQITLRVTGMSCAHCSARVEKALKSVEGVSSAKVDLNAGEATVVYDPSKADEERLEQAVMGAGYNVD